MKIFEKYTLGGIELSNRTVMAPMTRCRAVGNLPNDLMVEYYAQRAGAGLIISEGTAPSVNGLGYARMPGIFTEAQIMGWRRVTSAVHERGGKIFMQLMHTGRVSHPLNMARGAVILAPSAVPLEGQLYTDEAGLQNFPLAKEMSLADIENTIEEYVHAAENAIKAGFDGIELHGANGYLIEQFLNPGANIRTDEYGGSVENRCRFGVEVAARVAQAIGGDRTGIRISPYGSYKGVIPVYDTIGETNTYLSQQLGKLGVVYMHIVDHSSNGTPDVPQEIKNKISRAFGGTMIASGGFDLVRANETLEKGEGDLVAFARSFLANPDLVFRFKHSIALNAFDKSTFYTPTEKGYTDYSFARENLGKE